ncbi:MAG: FAD:protein FMN transferase [Paludibacteraceae bacterium]|nr:FAD:protein FMN transferase [Paludibacteraceae bacterium]
MRARAVIGIVALSLGCIVALSMYKRPPKAQYYSHQGKVFGTYYNIRYESAGSQEQVVLDALHEVDGSLSMFNPSSTLSRINKGNGQPTDSLFERVYRCAYPISERSNGAFDITVAPLVNAWGFGFQHRDRMTPARIDSLRTLVGFHKIRLVDHRLWKDDDRIMLDAGAIAKGFACDVVAERLVAQGCTNYLVDIGGEVIAHGVRQDGQPWSVGITKPIDDTTGEVQELQDIIHTSDLKMATSGNYRNFYYEDGLKRSHTVDPRTGYPVQHSLLSATITAPTCMLADALATTCMVLGEKEGLAIVEATEGAACYFIVSAPDGNRIVTSERWNATSQK